MAKSLAMSLLLFRGTCSDPGRIAAGETKEATVECLECMSCVGFCLGLGTWFSGEGFADQDSGPRVQGLQGVGSSAQGFALARRSGLRLVGVAASNET